MQKDKERTQSRLTEARQYLNFNTINDNLTNWDYQKEKKSFYGGKCTVLLYLCMPISLVHSSKMSGLRTPSFSDTQPTGVLTEVDIKWKIKESLVKMESKLTDIYRFSVAAVIILLGGDYEGSMINEMLFKELTSHLKLTMWVLKAPSGYYLFILNSNLSSSWKVVECIH